MFYRLAGIVFVGKSLVAGGGQNPIEPAKLGCAILHGPNVSNFAEVYRAARRAGRRARARRRATTLAAARAALFSDGLARLRAMARAAGESVERLGAGAVDNIMNGAASPISCMAVGPPDLIRASALLVAIMRRPECALDFRAAR